MSRHVNAATYAVSNGEEFFFDTNVWLRLYGPQTDPSEITVKTYSDLQLKILQSGAKIVICYSVLSEFVSNYIDIKFKASYDDRTVKYTDKKKRRELKGFQDILAEAASQANAILRLKNLEIIDLDYSVTQYTSLMSSIPTHSIDVNDILFCNLCQENGYTFVCHDADCAKILPLVTCLTKLLRN